LTRRLVYKTNRIRIYSVSLYISFGWGGDDIYGPLLTLSIQLKKAFDIVFDWTAPNDFTLQSVMSIRISHNIIGLKYCFNVVTGRASERKVQRIHRTRALGGHHQGAQSHINLQRWAAASSWCVTVLHILLAPSEDLFLFGKHTILGWKTGPKVVKTFFGGEDKLRTPTDNSCRRPWLLVTLNAVFMT